MSLGKRSLNLTKPTRNERLSAKFFDKHLSTISGLDNKAVVSANSFWEFPRHENFSIVQVDATDFRKELCRIWTDNPELKAIIEPLYELSQSVEEPSDSATEISPFIYAMF
jgi:hypothetical protein